MADYIRAARTVGHRLPPDRYHEIRYQQLVTSTESTMQELLVFLDEPWDDAVLEYYGFPDDVAPRYAALTRMRRKDASEKACVYKTQVCAYRPEIDPLIRLLIRLRGGSTLRELRYR